MTKKGFYFFVSMVCVAGYGWIFLNYFNHSVRWLGCLFYKITKIPCPSCGATRSAMALLQGNWRDALYYNPLGIVVLLMAIVLPVWILMDVIRRKESLFSFYKRINKEISFNIITVSIILLLLGNWIWNVFKYYTPNL